MYAENWLMYPYLQSFTQEAQQLEEFYCSQRPNASMTPWISDYDLGGEGDLFKAPEPILEEPLVDLDPMTAAISLISCGDDVISSQDLKISDIESSFENEQLLSEVLYECEKDVLAKDGTTEAAFCDVKIPIAKTDENMDSQGSMQKSVSSESLNTMDWAQGPPPGPNFFDFPGMDLGAVYGMRRSLSEGDIKTLGNGNINLIHSPLGQSQIVCRSISEDRKEKLSRYRIKKAKRNFCRKIKYACRKALADSQPRIRGRFAKTEEIYASKTKKH